MLVTKSICSIQSVQINEAILSNNYDVILDLVDEEMETINTEEDGEPMTLKHQYLILVKATFLMLIGDFPKCLETFAKLIDVETTDPKVIVTSYNSEIADIRIITLI